MKFFRHRTMAAAIALAVLSTAALSAQEYRVCLGSFLKPENAITLIEKTAKTGNKAVSELARVQGKVFTRVLLDETFATKEAALKKIESLKKNPLFAGKAGKDLWILASPGVTPASPAVKPPADTPPIAPAEPAASAQTAPSAAESRAPTAPEAAQEEAATADQTQPADQTASSEISDASGAAKEEAESQPAKPAADTNDGFGLVTGFIVDAATGKGLSGVLVTDDAGSSTAESGADGYFALIVPKGDRILSFELEGYAIPPFPVEAESKRQSALPFDGAFANPLLGRDEARFVLTWGASPADLDLHLITPEGGDVLAESGGRIESITAQISAEGAYKVGVHNYSGETPLSASGARLRVYNAAGLAGVLDIPAEGADGEPNVWIAGEYGPDGFIIINEFASY